MTDLRPALARAALPPLRIPVTRVPPPPLPAPRTLRRGLAVLSAFAVPALFALIANGVVDGTAPRSPEDGVRQAIEARTPSLPRPTWQLVGGGNDALGLPPGLVRVSSASFTTTQR